MKTILTSTAALAMALAVAAPASAQVSGIGVADPAVVVAGSKALQGAYSQIGTTYQAQRTQLEQLSQQRIALLKKLDTNHDGKLDEAEQKAAQSATNPVGKQLKALQDQINKVQEPINLAGAYAVQQIAQQLTTAVQQVVTQDHVQLIVPANGVLYASPEANVTEKVINALDSKLPQVSITPPAGWQPDQDTVQLFQDVQQVRLEAAMRQQQQQAAGAKPAAAPAAGNTSTPPVKGR